MTSRLHIKSLMRRTGVVSLLGATFWLALFPVLARDHEPDNNTAIAKLSEIKLGDSDRSMTRKLKSAWFLVPAGEFLQDNPYHIAVPYTNTAVITQWRANKDAWDVRPILLFAVFSDQHKTNLVDALVYDGLSTYPLVKGLYEKNLRSVKEGDSIQQVFALLGRRLCEYFQTARGEWRIKVFYETATGRNSNGENIEFEAEASSGKILKVTVLGNI